MNNDPKIVDLSVVADLLDSKPPTMEEVVAILDKASEAKGLNLAEVATLLCAGGQQAQEMILSRARAVKEAIYGRRVVLFAPLYLSSLCRNDCLYCGFRSSNRTQERHRLSLEEIKAETRALVGQGHRRLLVVAGDDGSPLRYLLDSIRTIYDEKCPTGEIRRINVNVAAMEVDAYRELKASGIGTYQLFQETYHPDTYAIMHPQGPKSNYGYHLSAMDRAIEGGLEDVGLGVLFGLHEWRFEVLAMLQHAFHLEERFGFGPHTVSVPRLEPASGSELSSHPPVEVTDSDFLRIIAVLRLALPYAGIILSTRETAQVRRQGLDIGVSQISAGSRTNPGGYASRQGAEQFSLGDHRTLDEVVADLVGLGHIPSFCTGCYRKGRTGHDFMDLAKPGAIQHFCLPNALTSFQEYLTQAASAQTRLLGEAAIDTEIQAIGTARVRDRTRQGVEAARSGAMDLYV
ncbi:MAG: [FeFe] hydrogenase H-cluster radical SAM maturase HydG [Fibrobacterota bacterium]|nr:[FeFe] hydrogenase H-cluster radical SAM maturase HydG [Fibrobacterota bacterium]QQS06180.1 MAG: [FeFe] hydrogenase H-cluster radical SAM maturase HydG [Fibrobacterota bacterium]